MCTVDDVKILEDDAFILRVIEAYCTSTKARQAVNSCMYNTHTLVCQPKKQESVLLPVTLPNSNRYSKFFRFASKFATKLLLISCHTSSAFLYIFAFVVTVFGCVFSELAKILAGNNVSEITFFCVE